MALKTGGQYRKDNRARNKEWRQKKLDEGYKNYNIMLSPEAQKVINHLKNTKNYTVAEAIESVLTNVNKGVTTNIFSNTVKTTKKQPKNVTTNINKNYDLKIIHEQHIKLKDDGKTNHQIAEILNEQGLLNSRGGKWNEKTISQAVTRYEKTLTRSSEPLE